MTKLHVFIFLAVLITCSCDKMLPKLEKKITGSIQWVHCTLKKKIDELKT